MQFCKSVIVKGLLQGRTYLCKKLDLGTKVATVRAADLKYCTKTGAFTDVHVVHGLNFVMLLIDVVVL